MESFYLLQKYIINKGSLDCCKLNHSAFNFFTGTYCENLVMQVK